MRINWISNIIHRLIGRQIVHTKDVKNLNDLKLLQVGWVFDINFHPALKLLLERRYLELIRDVLPASEKIDEVFRVVLNA